MIGISYLCLAKSLQIVKLHNYNWNERLCVHATKPVRVNIHTEWV
jgi:hypothetical protein